MGGGGPRGRPAQRGRWALEGGPSRPLRSTRGGRGCEGTRAPRWRAEPTGWEQMAPTETRRLVAAAQSRPTRRSSGICRGGGHTSFWGQVKPEPLRSLLGEVSSWGPSATWATKSPLSRPRARGQIWGACQGGWGGQGRGTSRGSSGGSADARRLAGRTPDPLGVEETEETAACVVWL